MTDGTDTTTKRKYSYFCLQWNNNLCLGISPGIYDPVEGLYVQLKPYMRNYYKGSESKKMRWDLIASELNAPPTNDTEYREGYLRLEAQMPTLCADRKAPGTTNIYLFTCDSPDLSTWVYDAAKGLLRLGDNPNLCATVTKCVPRSDPARSCIQSYNDVETNIKAMHEGSVIHLKPCWDYSSEYADSSVAQTFTRELDCVAGCSPDLLSNEKCDDICNNVACAHDKGECIDSPAPTIAPTQYFVTNAPTDPPTFGSEIGGNTALPEQPSYWWLIFIILLACCLATAAMLLRRNRRRKALQRAFEPEDGMGASSNLVQDQLMQNEEEDGDEARFKTASAVALNQLRYHSRVANSSSTSTAHVNGESVKRRPETSSNDKRYNFEEVGLV